MKKAHDLHQITINGAPVYYFYTREKNDRNGNSRYKIHIIDTKNNTVTETTAQAYECQLSEIVKNRVEEAAQ